MVYNEETAVRIMRNMLALGARSSHVTPVSVVKDVLENGGPVCDISVMLEKQSI